MSRRNKIKNISTMISWRPPLTTERIRPMPPAFHANRLISSLINLIRLPTTQITISDLPVIECMTSVFRFRVIDISLTKTTYADFHND
jgi:hypothetical protein